MEYWNEQLSATHCDPQYPKRNDKIYLGNQQVEELCKDQR